MLSNAGLECLSAAYNAYIGARHEARGRCKFGTSGHMAVSILTPIVRSGYRTESS